MAILKGFSLSRQIAFILVVFALWSVISGAWYVCGVRGLCAVKAEAHNGIAHEVETDTVALSVTQAPLMIAFERSGAAGEIFVMLLVAFVLGALLGRILAAPRTPEQLPLVFQLPEGNNPRTGLAERVGVPTHVSVFTKKTALVAASAPPPAPETTPVLASATNKPILMPAPLEKDRLLSSSLMGTAPTSKPIINTAVQKTHSEQLKVHDQNKERPKVRFNTSWSNPYRGK